MQEDSRLTHNCRPATMNLRRTFAAKKHRVSSYDDSPPVNLKLMSNSERGKFYRRRRKLYGAHLEERVAALNEEIATLTVSRQVQQELALSQRCTPLGAAANIVNEYCSLFNHGVPVRLIVDDQDVSISLVAHVSNTQRGFLQAVMNTDVRFGEFVGVGLLFDQWERYSLYHAAIKWTMKSLKVTELTEPQDLTSSNDYDDSSLVVSITADLCVQITRRTIEEVFPHLVGDEGLMQLLIGQEVMYPCINHFHFNRNGKIEWYNPEVDFVCPLTGVLKCPELVARVMGNALIDRDHMIGDMNDGRELAAVEAEVENTRLEVRPASSLELYEDTINRLWPNDGKLEDFAVVTRDELVFESSFSNRPKQLELSYILATD